MIFGRSKTKAAPFERRFILVPRGGASRFTLVLRNVIAERGEDHIVIGLGTDGEAGDGYAAGAGPGILGEVGVLHAELDTALRASVEPIPEAQSAFLDDADVAGAIGAI